MSPEDPTNGKNGVTGWRTLLMACLLGIGWQIVWHGLVASSVPGSGLAKRVYLYVADNGKTISILFDILIPALMCGIYFGVVSRLGSTRMFLIQCAAASAALVGGVELARWITGTAPPEAPGESMDAMLVRLWNFGVAALCVTLSAYGMRNQRNLA